MRSPPLCASVTSRGWTDGDLAGSEAGGFTRYGVAVTVVSNRPDRSHVQVTVRSSLPGSVLRAETGSGVPARVSSVGPFPGATVFDRRASRRWRDNIEVVDDLDLQGLLDYFGRMLRRIEI